MTVCLETTRYPGYGMSNSRCENTCSKLMIYYYAFFFL